MFFNVHFFWDKEKFVTLFLGTQMIIQLYSREEGCHQKITDYNQKFNKIY